MADIRDWVENLGGEEHLELETNGIPDGINTDEEIEDIRPEPEEDTEEPHPRRHKKKFSDRRLESIGSWFESGH